MCAQYVCVHSMYVRARVLLPWLFSPGPRPIRRTCPTLPPRRDQRPSLRRASPAVGARRVTGRTSRRTGSRRRGRRNRKRCTCGERGAERGARTLSLHVLAYSEARRTRASLSLHVRVLHTYCIPYMSCTIVRVDAPYMVGWDSISFSRPSSSSTYHSMRESRTGQSTFAPSAVKGVIMVGKTPQGRARGIATVYRSCTSRIKLGESINQSDYFQSKVGLNLRLQRTPHGKRRTKTHATTPHPHVVCNCLVRWRHNVCYRGSLLIRVLQVPSEFIHTLESYLWNLL